MSEPITTADLDAMQQRCARATPGPWCTIESRDVFSAVIASGIATICIDCENDHDAEFIAAVRVDLPRLIERVRELESQQRTCNCTISEQASEIARLLKGEI